MNTNPISPEAMGAAELILLKYAQWYHKQYCSGTAEIIQSALDKQSAAHAKEIEKYEEVVGAAKGHWCDSRIACNICETLSKLKEGK